MSIRTIISIFFAIGLAAASVYVYTLIDPRLDIIVLKNEEIMRLDNKIASLMDTNKKMNEQVSSIATVVKSNEKNSGIINDEYKICLRQTTRLKKSVGRLNAEVSVLNNKNKIMQEFLQVKNDVISLKEQIENLTKEKQELTDQLGPDININHDIEGAVIPHEEMPVNSSPAE